MLRTEGQGPQGRAALPVLPATCLHRKEETCPLFSASEPGWPQGQVLQGGHPELSPPLMGQPGSFNHSVGPHLPNCVCDAASALREQAVPRPLSHPRRWHPLTPCTHLILGTCQDHHFCAAGLFTLLSPCQIASSSRAETSFCRICHINDTQVDKCSQTLTIRE